MAHQATSVETMFGHDTIEAMTSQTLPIGSVLSERYRIDAFLAEGGMALVYRAHDLRLERDVALKIVKDEFANSPDYLDAFINEAKLAARVSHPNLVNVFDQGVDGDFDYLVMELVVGKTLREIMSKFTKIEPSRALDVVASVLAGLSALHRAGIVHRDVKPENIILANDGRIKVTDFGLARPTSETKTAGTPLLGTVAYIAPEVLRGEQLDSRSDLYSVGVVLFELVTGTQPFAGESSKDVAKEIAKGENVEMSDNHWEVVNFLRQYYDEYQIAPAVRVLTKAIGKQLGPEKGNSQYLYELFPYGPAKQACKIGGLPKPVGLMACNDVRARHADHSGPDGGARQRYLWESSHRRKVHCLRSVLRTQTVSRPAYALLELDYLDLSA